MEKTLIRQNAQWNGKMFDHLCPRDIMDNLLKKKTMRHVQILTGVRRCGKSTVFKLLINDLVSRFLYLIWMIRSSFHFGMIPPNYSA